MLALRALDGDLLPLAPHPNTDRKDDIMTDRPDHATEWIAKRRELLAAALGIETGAGDE